MALVVLWREHPVKVVAALLSPPINDIGLFGCFSRRRKSFAFRIFFGFCILGIFLVFFAVTSGNSEHTGKTVSILNRSFTASSVATGVMSSLLLYMLKNVASSVRHPGSLAVLKSDIVSFKVHP